MDRYIDLLSKRLKSKGMSEAVEASYLLYKLNKVSEDYIVKKYSSGTLYCQIARSEKSIYLKQHTNQIIRDLNKLLKANKITKIIWSLNRNYKFD